MTVVVPNYNYERYLSDRLRSIFDQTYPIFETLVLDDASTDESLARSTIAAATGRRFRLVTSEKNSGSPFSQWERGCRLAEENTCGLPKPTTVAILGFSRRS